MAAQEKLKTAFRSGFHADTKSLILKLLVDNPTMRLGMQRNGFGDIWELPFYSGNVNYSFLISQL